MKKFIVFFALVALVLVTAGVSRSNGGKVTICHYPPGNPDSAKTLVIDASSVADHQAHGDTLGPCP